MENFRMLHACCFLFFLIKTTISLDIITPSQSIRDGETLVSAGGTFELGFFSPGNSKNRYLGVWYKNISPFTVVWVANREIPLNNSSGVLQVNDHGILVLFNATNSSVWSSNTSRIAENPIAQLLDSGNLLVKNGQDLDEEHFLWQSFDYPCDTLLPGMKLGWDLVSGLDRFLSSWKSPDDPSPGEYVVKIDLRGYPQIVQMKGSVISARAGSWNGLGFTGYPARKNPIYKLDFVFNEKEVYYEYQLLNKSVVSRFLMNPSGFGQRLVWTKQTSDWEIISSRPTDQCGTYGFCGGYSTCDMSSNPICACLNGFVPKNQEEWDMSYWSNGCVPRTNLDCYKNDGFQKYTNMQLPDTSSSWFSKTMSLDECQKSCLANCSCTAYANLDIRNGGSGCLLWFDNLIDMRKFPQWGQDLYIRLPASELDHTMNNDHRNFRKKKLIVGVAVGFTVLVMGLMILTLTKAMWKRKLEKTVLTKICCKRRHKNKQRNEDMDMPTFDLSIISKATDNFSCCNKLGEGGYGPVYKGILLDGQEIAVKRLSLNSRQGLEELKNEVALIAKLQHRNLVRLLGCCIQGEEKMLIYEYMPNKSLDFFIFDQTRSKSLDWFKRYHIIDGIARGLLYLHQDSRLRIIHRDLKTSNVLLDAHMNPKISDFGLARTFGGDQVEANTNRVVGTYGYMPPEYAVHGHFSVKSDIFSFGVIVIEIVSGKKNRGFSDPKYHLNLLGHAWRLWNEERPLELIDELLCERCIASEVIRCIQVGLLCVQQKPEDRPDMSSVVLMLNGEKAMLNPKLPGFYTGGDTPEAEPSSRNCNPFSQNEISLTVLEAR